eukprot:1620628-Rhodomonas_salina.1
MMRSAVQGGVSVIARVVAGHRKLHKKTGKNLAAECQDNLHIQRATREPPPPAPPPSPHPPADRALLLLSPQRTARSG